jgi:uncharacterized protein (DUF849 family)
MSKTILTCAVTGNQTTRAQHPGLPCTPKEIADACIGAAKAGAAITHIHARYDDGRPSMELAHYKEIVDRIRDSSTDVIINLTTGPGQRFVPGKDDPSVAGPGTTLTNPMRRVEHVLALKPEICTLDLNTMWSGTSVVINSPESISTMAAAMKEAGSKPELEVFDGGDIQLAKMLIEKGVLETPAMFQIVTGIRFGFEQTPQTMAYARSILPPGAVWAGFGIGRMAYPMLASAFLLGGHVRCGLEDAVNLRKGVLARDNAAMCLKAAHIVDELGGELATVAEAREILGLKR